MKLDLRNNKDFLSGLMFIVTGLGAIFVARDYPVGSTCEPVRARRHPRFAAHQASPPTA